jgi:hypothetical protein
VSPAKGEGQTHSFAYLDEGEEATANALYLGQKHRIGSLCGGRAALAVHLTVSSGPISIDLESGQVVNKLLTSSDGTVGAHLHYLRGIAAFVTTRKRIAGFLTGLERAEERILDRYVAIAACSVARVLLTQRTGIAVARVLCAAN